MFEKDPEILFQVNDLHSPHSIVIGLVKPGSSVLDVGCNAGYIGKYLITNKNCTCDGIDYLQEFLDKSKQSGYRNAFKIDLYNKNFQIDAKYDALLFIDILEHLPNPHEILFKLINENLKNGGRAIICLPNIARFEHRINHLIGKFEYEKSGIMHQDHLRFFTKKSALDMLKKIPLDVEKIIPTGLGHRLGIFQDLTAFQFIFVCKK